MSRGPGRVQQTITELIASDPRGAWTVGQICERIYPDELLIKKKHRVAVTRALRHMELPGTWVVRRASRQGSEYCLYDKCDEESTARADYLGWWKQAPVSFWTWTEKFPGRIEKAAKKVKEARRYRDASPIEKLDIEIAELKYEKGRYGGSGPYADACQKQIVELIEKKKALGQAQAT